MAVLRFPRWAIKSRRAASPSAAPEPPRPSAPDQGAAATLHPLAGSVLAVAAIATAGVSLAANLSLIPGRLACAALSAWSV